MSVAMDRRPHPVDLAGAGKHACAIEEIKQRLAASCTARQQCRHFPKAKAAAAWAPWIPPTGVAAGVPGELLRPIMLAVVWWRSLSRQRLGRQRHSIRLHVIRSRLRLRDLKRARLVHPRNGSDFGPAASRQRYRAGEIDTAILSPGTDKIVAQIPLRRLGTTTRWEDHLRVVHGGVSYVNGPRAYQCAAYV